MNKLQSPKVENYVLFNEGWNSGFVRSTVNGTPTTFPTRTLEADDASKEERVEAVRLLNDKFGITSKLDGKKILIQSTAEDKAVEKFSALTTCIADPSSWSDDSGAKKLSLETLSGTQSRYAKSLFENLHVKAGEVDGDSRSLRVEKEEVEKLVAALPSAFPAETRLMAMRPRVGMKGWTPPALTA
jgi:hypothetical protein